MRTTRSDLSQERLSHSSADSRQTRSAGGSSLECECEDPPTSGIATSTLRRGRRRGSLGHRRGQMLSPPSDARETAPDRAPLSPVVALPHTLPAEALVSLTIWPIALNRPPFQPRGYPKDGQPSGPTKTASRRSWSPIDSRRPPEPRPFLLYRAISADGGGVHLPICCMSDGRLPTPQWSVILPFCTRITSTDSK